MEEHPFAAYVRILARGKTKSRPFTEEEAETCMAMIMRGEVEPEQLGAYLMLIRFKEETAEEVAGFVRGARLNLELPDSLPPLDLDWSSYAGKRRQLPWFLLSVLMLAGGGVRVFMHGTDGHTDGRVYTRATLEVLGLPVAGNLAEAADHIENMNFAYVSLEDLQPRLQEIIDLKPVLGLRSPAHTIGRMLNPFAAPYSMQGIFHRGFMDTHQKAGLLLGQSHMAVFRGEGGEIECRPNKTTDVRTVHDGKLGQEEWPRVLAGSPQAEDEEMNIQRLVGVWTGEIDDEYAAAAVTGTAAIALKLMGKASNFDEAQAMAEEMWQNRNRTWMGIAA